MKKFILMIAATLAVSSGFAQFNPDNPDEPAMTYNVTVSCIPENIAYVTGSGTGYRLNDDVWISTSSYNGNYRFKYWTLNGQVYSVSQYFNYKVTKSKADFVAHYEYVPDSPDDPAARYLRRVYLKSEPENVASFNMTSGEKHEVGEMFYLCAYGAYGYDFLGWYSGSQKISDSPYFDYMVTDTDVTLTAKFVFSPSSPDDPSNFYSRTCEVNVIANNPNGGSISVSNLTEGRAVLGDYVTLNAYAADGYRFCGWSDGTGIVSTDAGYMMLATRAINYMAMFYRYGDCNGDDKVDAGDIAAISDYIYGLEPDGFNVYAADLTGNGIVNVADITRTISIILEGQ